MAKVTAKEVTNGMVFLLEKEEGFGFCWEKGSHFFHSSYNPPLKSELVVIKAPYKDQGNQMVDFSIKGDPKEYTTHWSTFKNNTTYVSGVLAPKTGVVITSTGPFAGFDLAVNDTHVEDFLDCGFMIYKIDLEFIGTFTGAKKLSTKMINQIKTSPGFREECKNLLTNHLKLRETKIKEYISKSDARKAEDFWKGYGGAPVRVHYKSGKIEFVIILTQDYDTVIDHIHQQVDCFIAAKTTNVPFLG